MRTRCKLVFIVLLVCCGTHSIAADFQNAGECLTDAYAKHKPARVAYWTQYYANRIPSLPENQELRDAYAKYVVAQEDMLEIELNHYLLHDGKNARLVSLPPFTTPNVRLPFVDERDRGALLKSNTRYAELDREFESLNQTLSKYDGHPVPGLTKQYVDRFTRTVGQKLREDFDASLSRIKSSCDAYNRR